MNKLCLQPHLYRKLVKLRTSCQQLVMHNANSKIKFQGFKTFNLDQITIPPKK
jgi:hypothetical protein